MIKYGGKTMNNITNSIGIQTAQHTDKDLLAGLSKTFERFSKEEAGIRTIESFDLVETKIGTAQARLRIDGRSVRLNISPLQGVGHTVKKHDGTSFFKIEPTTKIKAMSFMSGGHLATVDIKEDIIPILSTLDFGTDVAVEMDNGFIFDGKVCDINRTDRFQFFKLIEAMGDKLGLTVGKTEIDGRVIKKAILRQGKPISSGELMDIFAQRGIGATVQCAFSTNNLTGEVSMYDIGIPENRRA